MFSKRPCSHKDCVKPALSFREQCYLHLSDKKTYRAEIQKLLSQKKTHIDLVLDSVPLSDIDLSEKNFFACSFTKVTWNKVTMQKARIRLCYFNHASFSECNFSQCDFQWGVFACSHFRLCNFTDTEILYTNFNGVMADECDFSSSDLYASRFIKSNLLKAKMIDCNLKSTLFFLSKIDLENFKYSNYEDASFEEEGV